MTNQSPKSAYELAMEKLEAQDQVTGEASAELSPEQIEAIANARQDYEAKLAECKILHQSQMVSTFDPAARRTRSKLALIPSCSVTRHAGDSVSRSVRRTSLALSPSAC